MALKNGLEGDIHLPALYPNTHSSDDDQIRLGRATDWNGADNEPFRGIGGKLFLLDGATKPGTMVYNSWLTMQANGEKDANACAYNDIALVRLDPADAANVDPTIPFWGGPNGLATSQPAQGSEVYSYGNSSLRGGLAPLSPKQGVLVQNGGARITSSGKPTK